MLNLGQVLAFEGYLTFDSKNGLPALDITNMIPFDITTMSIFTVFHLSFTEYIGRSELDYAQYFALRTLPFLSFLLDQMTILKS